MMMRKERKGKTGKENFCVYMCVLWEGAVPCLLTYLRTYTRQPRHSLRKGRVTVWEGFLLSLLSFFLNITFLFYSKKNKVQTNEGESK